jgi:DNA-binding NtrC family response regulator
MERAGDPTLRLLAVGPGEEELFCLRAICDGAGWTLQEAHTVDEALARLHEDPVPVVLCQQDLPDGPWTELLDAAERLRKPPHLIVWSRHADNRLWAEVLNLGGIDVLATPFRVAEVVHAVRMAVLRWGREATAAGRGRSRVSAA